MIDKLVEFLEQQRDKSAELSDKGTEMVIRVQGEHAAYSEILKKIEELRGESDKPAEAEEAK